MSCTNDCGCSPEIRDARTDEWVQIAPEPARPATLTPERAGQRVSINILEVERADRPIPRDISTLAGLYADVAAAGVTVSDVLEHRAFRRPGASGVKPRPTRVYFDAPQEPVLPRRIKPEDVQVGMVVERRNGEAAHRDRVQQIDGELIVGTDGAWLWVPGNAVGGWNLWLIEDAPEPVDPTAALVERMAEAMWRIEEKPPTDYAGAVDDPEGWQELAEAALLALRETHDVTPRAEQ